MFLRKTKNEFILLFLGFKFVYYFDEGVPLVLKLGWRCDVQVVVYIFIFFGDYSVDLYCYIVEDFLVYLNQGFMLVERERFFVNWIVLCDVEGQVCQQGAEFVVFEACQVV